MGQAQGQPARSARCIALVGPYLSGKTTLLEAILARTGAINRQGTAAAGNTVGDASEEARHHGMSVELNAATVDYLGDSFTFLDCPGSIEFQADAANVLAACDAAVVVCEPDAKKVPALQLILKQLEDRGIPHFLFLNKIDKAEARVRDIIPMLQPASTVPLVLRQVPIWEGGIVSGFIDLALERAHVYREHATSEVIDIPDALTAREQEARFSMLEQLADYDDELMEQLLEDVPPPRDKVFDDLALDLREGVICPVLLGSAENGNGIVRLLKALRHEAPFVEAAAERLGVGDTASCAVVMKTIHTAHAGKLTLARVLAGTFADGDAVFGGEAEERIAGTFYVLGQEPVKRGPAGPGDTVAFGRLESVETGDTLSTEKGSVPAIARTPMPEPVFGLALVAKEKKDEVKLTTGLAKIIEEDPSISIAHEQDMGQMILWGQGEMHLRVALERLIRKYGAGAATYPREVPYKETIRKPTQVRGRHKKQSGGHGQFGDVVITIKPQPRGGGFDFSETITGGVVPKNYIPSVEHGVRDYLHSGPLGFQVVDVAVCLVDGSYHSVDSSDMAFRQAGRLAMTEGLPQCQPVLLEPVMAVEIAIPSEATPRVNSIVSSHRGQILGFDARPGWQGWDVVQAYIPEAEIQTLIVELRSATAGVGTFQARHDHLAELVGKAADQVLSHRRDQAA
ncbi:MAG: elongation factor G [Methyloceanibacter sp.]|jgi:elongation factor G|uniref:elongation factor G n=1 Tax=Methyloceanibacter sp. TaxID=1965321 RepID=UPI003C311CB7